jgi:hypothetical protein
VASAIAAQARAFAIEELEYIAARTTAAYMSDTTTPTTSLRSPHSGLAVKLIPEVLSRATLTLPEVLEALVAPEVEATRLDLHGGQPKVEAAKQDLLVEHSEVKSLQQHLREAQLELKPLLLEPNH